MSNEVTEFVSKIPLIELHVRRSFRTGDQPMVEIFVEGVLRGRAFIGNVDGRPHLVTYRYNKETDEREDYDPKYTGQGPSDR